NIVTTDKDLKSPAQVGNGNFAIGFDFTGLQTFGHNANTMSNWGWHEFPLPRGETPKDFKGQVWPTQDREIRYDIQNPEQPALTAWMIQNPQRINLGRIGFVYKKEDGEAAPIEEYQDTKQTVNLW